MNVVRKLIIHIVEYGFSRNNEIHLYLNEIYIKSIDMFANKINFTTSWEHHYYLCIK